MGKKLVLYDKIYNITSERKKKDFFIRYLKYLKEKIKGFPTIKIYIKKLRDYDNRFEIFISGPEEIFVFNLFRKEIGSINEFKEIKVGKIFKGTMVDVGNVGFGIFVDCAVMNPKVDVLINLHSLRKQLCNDKEKSLRDIINAYEFIDHFPVHVRIIEVDLINNKIQGELSENSLKLFQKILDKNIEGLFMSGETKGQFKKALLRNGHLRDVISLKRYGFLEHIALLKENSNAPGIISKIGKDLKNCKLSAIRPERIKNLCY
ncbi:MAG: DUF2110 family protein [Candidatus Thorarchaeota archaeon]